MVNFPGLIAGDHNDRHFTVLSNEDEFLPLPLRPSPEFPGRVFVILDGLI